MPNQERTAEQRVPIPGPSPASEVIDIVFNVARGRILPEQPQVEIEGFEPVVRAESVPGNVLRLRRSAGERARRTEGAIPPTKWITVRGQGVTPELVKIIYRGPRSGDLRTLDRENDQVLAVYAPAPGACSDDADFLFKVELTQPNPGSESTTLDPATYLADLDALLTAAPDTPTTRYRKYFATLNLQTHPDLIDTLPAATLSSAEKTDRKQWIGWLMAILHDRVVKRANAFNVNPADPWADTVSDGVERIQELSTVQLGVADQFFLDGNGVWDEASFQEAYEMFANGDLRLQLPSLAWSTQPSSGYFFFFAEFALLAMDQDIDADRWGVLAPALVRAQHIFARVFQPADPDTATFMSYRGCNYDPLQVYTASELAQLVVDNPYATEHDLRLGAGANAKKYLPAVLT